MGLGLSKRTRTAKVGPQKEKRVSTMATKGQSATADEFTICKMLVPSRILEHYLIQAEILLNAEEDFSTTTQNKIVPKSFAEEYEAAVLFADISGFSRLAEVLNKELSDSANAAEDLSNYVGLCLHKMVEKITEAGGDVIKFAGDAILAVFPTKPEANLEACTLIACQVAMGLLTLDLPAGGVKLSVHCGVGTGTILGYHVGGLNNRWEYFISGDVIEQIGSAEKEAEAGEVVVSSEALVMLVRFIVDSLPKSHVPAKLQSFIKEHKGSDDYDMMVIHLKPFLKGEEQKPSKDGLLPLTAVDTGTGSGNFNLIDLREMANYGRKKTRESAKRKDDDIMQRLRPSSQACDLVREVLKCYIPGPVRLSISAKQSLLSNQFWLCTTLFIRLTGLVYDTNIENVSHVTDVVKIIQKQLYLLEGTLCRFIVDDKGTGILAAFGLPPYAQHENDAARGCELAMNVNKQILTKWPSHRVDVGVTSGRVYAGVVGGHTRCEYTLHGSVVNLAARLMVAAGKDGDEILVNDGTYRGAVTEINFDQNEKRIKCKGYLDPIPVWRPTSKRRLYDTDKSGESDYKCEIELICDTEHIAAINAAFNGVKASEASNKISSESTILFIEAEAGMGKSRYCRYIKARAQNENMNAITCACNETGDPYHVWKQIWYHILNMKDVENAPQMKWARLKKAVPDEKKGLAPLLRDVFPEILGKHTGEDKTTNLLQGSVRANALCLLLIDMLQKWLEEYGLDTSVQKPKLNEKALKLIGASNNEEAKEDGTSHEIRATKNEIRATKSDSKLVSLLRRGRSKSLEAKRKAYLDVIPLHETLEKDNYEGHVIICEDLHWMDETSLSLLLKAVSVFPSILFVLTCRPTPRNEIRSAINELKALSNVTKLSKFSEAQVKAAIKSMVKDADSVNPLLAKHIYEVVKGHPLFTLEIIQLLYTKGKIGVPGKSFRKTSLNTLGEHRTSMLMMSPQKSLNSSSNAATRLHSESENMCQIIGREDFSEIISNIDLPNTVRGIMRGRFTQIAGKDDRARMQHLLKIASVFNHVFSVDILLEILPLEDYLSHEAVPSTDASSQKDNKNTAKRKEGLLQDLGELEKMGFIKRDESSALSQGVCYRFEQSMMQKAAYDMLLFEHRRNHHTRIAHLLESRYAGRKHLVYPELAQHFFKAEDAAKSIEYLEKAADMHYAAHQVRLAKNCFSRLLRITGELYHKSPKEIYDRRWHRGVENLEAIVKPHMKARWSRLMGDILLDEGEYAAALPYYTSALDILECPHPPTTKIGIKMSKYKFKNSSLIKKLKESKLPENLLEAAQIYSSLGTHTEANYEYLVSFSKKRPKYPFAELENRYTHAIIYALAADKPEQSIFVMACMRLVIALGIEFGPCEKANNLAARAETNLPDVTEVKSQISVQEQLGTYALTNCSYEEAEKHNAKLIRNAHSHHLQSVQLLGLELMWTTKRFQGKWADIIQVASDARGLDPILGLIYIGFGAAEAGNFSECVGALEIVRQSVGHHGLVNKYKRSASTGSSSSGLVRFERGTATPFSGRPSILRDSNASTERVSSLKSNVSSDSDNRKSHLMKHIGDIDHLLKSMPQTVMTAAALSHYCLRRGKPMGALACSIHGLSASSAGLLRLELVDFLALSSCLAAGYQAQFMDPDLKNVVGDDGIPSDDILQSAYQVLLDFSRNKPCCKPYKKYLRGWEAARHQKWGEAKKHWAASVLYSKKLSMEIDLNRALRVSTALDEYLKFEKEKFKSGKKSSQKYMASAASDLSLRSSDFVGLRNLSVKKFSQCLYSKPYIDTPESQLSTPDNDFRVRDTETLPGPSIASVVDETDN